ncbi:MAG: hypothetical protein WC959_01090 [Kiritimatiellales bacterium]
MNEKISSAKESENSSFRFRRDEDIEFYELLKKLIGTGTAQLFRDACYLINLDDEVFPEHKIYLIGHLLRELDSSIFGIIKPIAKENSSSDADENSGGDQQARSKAQMIDAILDLLKCEDKQLSKRLKKISFQGIAHRDGLSPAKKINDELIETFETFVSIYRDLLLLCEKSFQFWHKKVDQLLKAQHCPKDLKSVVPRNEALIRYLFDRLDKPEWFTGLRKSGFLEIDEASDGVKWSQTQYLIRIADKLPTEILDFMLATETDDSHLLCYFTEAGINMPKEQCEEWANYLSKKIQSQPFLRDISLVSKTKKLLLRLIDFQSESELIFDFLSVVLKNLSSLDDDNDYSRTGYYEYRDFLKSILSKISEHDKIRLAELLAAELDRFISEKWPRATKEDDLSTHWLPAIEDHDQNDDYYIEGSVVIALRDVLESSIKQGTSLQSWLDWLKERNSLVYVRLSIHLVRLFGSNDDILLCASNRAFFEDANVIHEYLLLLRKGFSFFDQRSKEKILSWIDEIPEDSEVPEQFRKDYQNWQQYRRLRFLKDYLNDVWREKISQLNREEDEDEALDRLSFDNWTGSGFVAEKSPISSDEIQRMPVEKLMTYLSEYTPSAKHLHWTTERGLKKAITVAISENPEKYANKIDVLKKRDVNPAFISGISEAIIGSMTEFLSENNILGWIIWCMQLSSWEREYDGEQYKKQYGEVKRDLLRYLRSRIHSDAKNPIPFIFRKDIFSIIQLALTDVDPSVESTWDNPHNIAINSVRGCAMELAISYGLWVKRESDPDSLLGFSCLPELQQLLDERLNQDIEPSPAIRSCYGFFLPNIWWMDKKWVKENLTKIFPEEEIASVFFDAVWETYFRYGDPFFDLYDDLKLIYQRALSFPEIKEPEKDNGNARRGWVVRFCHHLVLFYTWGKIDVSETDILCQFMHEADPSYQVIVLEYMGRILDKNKDLQAESVERFKLFHEWWEKEIAPVSPKGWDAESTWFISEYFDKKWKLEKLVSASKHTTFSYQNDEVLNHLIEYFNNFPREVMETVANYINQQLRRPQQWALESKNALPEILKLGHHHEDEFVKETADTLLGKLIAAGFLKYRAIVEK